MKTERKQGSNSIRRFAEDEAKGRAGAEGSGYSSSVRIFRYNIARSDFRTKDVAPCGGRPEEKSELKPFLSTGLRWRNQKEEKQKYLKFCRTEHKTNCHMRYIIYCRKSTDEKTRQVLSIDGQLSELKEFAKRENLQIVDTVLESKTAKEPGREKFADLLKRIEKGEANGILSWHPDRLARNSVDGGKIIYLLDIGKLTNLKFPTFWFDNTPQGKFMLNIAFGQSKYYVDNLSENVKRGLREKLRRGVWPKLAPIGYFNDLKIKSIEVDIEKSKYIKKAFEKFSEGAISYSEIARMLFKGGIYRKGERVMKVGTIKNMLTNKFYIGTFLYNGVMYKGSHATFISKDLFNKVQIQMERLSRPRLKGHNFPFTGFIKCNECGSAITAETHPRYYKRTDRKVIFNYYRCTKSLGNCTQKYITDVELEKQIRNIVLKCSLDDEGYKIFMDLYEKDKLIEEQSASQRLIELQSKISNLEDQEETLLDGYIQHIIEPEVYKKKKNEIFEEKLKFVDQKSKFSQKGGGRLEPLLELIKIAKTGDKIARAKSNCEELAVFAKNAGSNFFLENRHLKPVLKNGFNSLFSSGRPPHGATSFVRKSLLARLKGIEPLLEDLESPGLPLTYSP